MRRLVDGAYAVVSRGGVAEVRVLDGQRPFVVAAEGAEALRAIALGVDAPGVEGLYRVLCGAGLACDTDDVDATWTRRLTDLGATRRWPLRRFPEAEALVAAARRHLLTHRLFSDPHGGEVALPESTALRCLQVLEGATRVAVLRDVSGVAAAVTATGHRPKVFNDDVSGSFNVVFVDPPPCVAGINAFLDRAAHLAADGARISLVAHPLHRDDVTAAAARISLAADGCMAEHTVSLLAGLVMSAHRWDHHVFRRTADVHPAEPGAWEDTPPGTPLRDTHAHTDVVLDLPRAQRVDEARHAIQRALTGCGAAAEVLRETAGSHWQLLATFAGGGHLAVSLDVSTGRLAYDLFPFHAGLDAALAHHLLARRSGTTSQR